jgi:hypothetical protein
MTTDCKKMTGCLLALTLLAAVPACGGGGGGSGSHGGSGGSSGSSGSGGGVDVTAWEGNWTLGGTQATTCPTGTKTVQLNGVVIISAGAMPGTIATELTPTCTVDWDVNGTTAMIQKGQVCTVAVNGVSVTVDFTSGSLSLNGASITGLTSGATNNGCSFTQQVTLIKM